MVVQVQPDVSASRLFRSGDVRIIGTRFNGRVGYLCEDNGNDEEDKPYLVMLYDEEIDKAFSASELSHWIPSTGDVVTELHSDQKEVGVVLANDGTTSHIQWTTRNDAPYWPNIRLEPSCY